MALKHWYTYEACVMVYMCKHVAANYMLYMCIHACKYHRYIHISISGTMIHVHKVDAETKEHNLKDLTQFCLEFLNSVIFFRWP